MSFVDPAPALSLPVVPPGRAEGVAIGRAEDRLAVAESEGERVSIYALESGAEPQLRLTCVLEGAAAGIGYPHDVDFSPDGRLLAVANRVSECITLYAESENEPLRYGPRPVWRLHGRRSRLHYPDGVKFVPPDGRFLAAVNLWRSSITFYRRSWLGGARYRRRACLRLAGERTHIREPDGLDFSPDGAFLAVANHGAHTVTIHPRAEGRALFRPEPVAVLGGTPSRHRYPHSVAFSTDGRHLAVSNAGGPTVTVYARSPGPADRAWSGDREPAFEIDATDPEAFARVNRDRKDEGGAKGVALSRGWFAYGNPLLGVRLHRVRTPHGVS